jgi:hypothetical protein
MTEGPALFAGDLGVRRSRSLGQGLIFCHRGFAGLIYAALEYRVVMRHRIHVGTEFRSASGEIIYVASVQTDTNIDLLTLAKH